MCGGKPVSKGYVLYDLSQGNKTVEMENNRAWILGDGGGQGLRGTVKGAQAMPDDGRVLYLIMMVVTRLPCDKTAWNHTCRHEHM